MQTSRERVMAAVNHREPDRVPIDLGGHRSSGIMAIAYNKLKRHLGITTGDIYVYDFVQQLAIIEPEVRERFGVDTIELGRGFALKPEDWQAWVLPDGTPCKIPAAVHPVKVGNAWCVYHEDGTLIAIQTEGCLYLEQTWWPYMDAGDVDFADLEKHFDHMMWAKVGAPPAPIGYDPQGLAELAAGAKALRASTDRAIIGLFGGSLFEGGQQLFRIDNFLAMLAGEKTLAHRFLDRLVEYYLDNLANFCPRSARTLILCFSATTSACRPGRRSRRAATASFSSRVRRSCGVNPRGWRTPGSCCTPAAASIRSCRG